MPLEKKDLPPHLRKLVECNPDLFLSCDVDGKPDQHGKFWRGLLPEEKPPQPEQK